IKPENIFVTTPSPDTLLAKVLDFGLARQADGTIGATAGATAREERTSTDASRGEMLGTPGYVSPEQAHGQPVDVRTDIFSFGVVLYEMLANIRPFRGESPVAVMLAASRQEPRPLRDIVSDLPGELDEIVRRCMKKKAEERYPDGTALSAALDGFVRRRASASGRFVNAIGSSPSLPLVSAEELSAARLLAEAEGDAPTTGAAAIAAMTTRDEPLVEVEQRRRERIRLLAAIGSGLAVAIVVVIAVLAWRSPKLAADERTSSDASGKAATHAPTEAVAPSAPPTSVATTEPTTLELPETAPVAPAVVDAASPSVATTQRTTAPASAAKRKKPLDDCTQPFVVDSKGVRIPKLHCLK
ncbi:MAG: serine/threonine protein kinase, partial [Labilithrix sp.]|nr:serine/threonine protein kinase [Labilithrix sp.]